MTAQRQHGKRGRTNFILENANNPGTGAVTLAGAPVGRRTFLQGFASGSLLFYFLDDGAQTEWGVGTLAGGPPATLTRSTVFGNSAGTAAALNFTGAVRVYNSLPAGCALWADGTAVYQAQGRRVANLAPGINAADVPRLDQVGWRTLGTFGVQSGAFFLPLASNLSRFRAEFQGLTSSITAPFYMRGSTDSGATYNAGASDYVTQAITAAGNSLAAPTSTGSFAPISQNNSPNFPLFGAIEISRATNQWFGMVAGNTGAASTTDFRSGFFTFAGSANALVFSVVGGSVTAGTIRLLGAI